MSTSRAGLDRRFLLVIFGAGLVLRLLWQFQIDGSLSAFTPMGEATNVAIALAEGRGFADAYFAGSGPTAHLMPVNPALAALMLTVFGIGTPASNVALLGLALAQVGFAYLMLARLFDRLGVAPIVLRLSLVTLCLLPVFVQREVIDFRYWEGALALGLAAASMAMLARHRAAASMSLGAKARAALLAAVTFLVSPVAGVAVVACWAVFSLRTEPFRNAMLSAATVAAAFALVVGPWALRNHLALGTPVVRSNAGLELAIANHPAALSAAPAGFTFTDRVTEIHPVKGQQGRARMAAAGGEVEYYRRLGAEAQAWIVAHPADFMRLTVRHARQLHFPERWAFEINQWDQYNAQRAAMIALVHALGLLSLAIGLLSGRRGYAMLAIYLASVTLTYAIVQPVPRYTYLVYGPLVFVALDGLTRAVRWVRRAVRHPRSATARVTTEPLSA